MSTNKSKTTRSGTSSRSSSSSRSGKSTSSKQSKSSASQSAGNRKSSTQKKSNSKKGTTRSRSYRYQPSPVRRLVGAAVCFLLSVFGFLTYFKQVDAIFINFFREVLKGLFGYGFWFVPPALLISGVILLIHHFRTNGPAGRRVVCTLLLPLIFGGLIHAILVSGQFTLTELKPLWQSGLTLASGGAAAGWLSVLFCKLFSRIGTIVLYVLALLFCAMLITRITPLDIVDAIRRYIAERPAYPDEAYDDEGDEAYSPRSQRAPISRRRKQASIDIPTESGDGIEPIARKGKHKKSEEPLFERQSAVRPPHELLAEEAAQASVQVPEQPAKEPDQEELLASLGLEFPDLDQISTKTEKPAVGKTPETVKRTEPSKDDTDIFGTVGISARTEEPEPEFAVEQMPEVSAAEPQPEENVVEPEKTDVPETIPAETAASVQPEAEERKPVSAAEISAPTFEPIKAAAPASVAEKKAVPAVQAPASEQRVKSEAAVAVAKARMGVDAENYQYPPADLLERPGVVSNAEAADELQTTRELLDDTIQSFGIDARIINVTRGPSVTRYELELMRGVKLSKLTNLAGDIALSLGAASVRIAPITGRNSVVGVEVPNQLVTPVPIREVIDSREFRTHVSKVAFAVGKDISGKNVVGNIAKLPHMLIAGTTGSGKSVCTNSLIISLLYKASPEDVRLIMVDPKMVELGIYNGIPHLLIPVVTDPKKAAGALQWAVNEMMKRYRLFSEVGVRDLASYNAHMLQQEGGEKLPQIVVVIDELADLMLVAAKEVEESICRVAQMGRAAGMHLVIATQRPSSDVITGLMKANIPSRIAFAVASSLESRIILDNTGAEKLVGKGDMLYAPLGIGKPMRVQGCMITDEEVARVVEFVKQNSSENYDSSVMKEVESNAENTGKGGKGSSGSGSSSASADDSADDADELLPNAVEVVLDTGMASVSMLQRRLKLGYSRAARLVDQMEERGIVGPFEGSKPRQVLITREQWLQRTSGSGSDASGIPAEEYAAALAMSEASDADAQAMPDYEDEEGDAPF